MKTQWLVGMECHSTELGQSDGKSVQKATDPVTEPSWPLGAQKQSNKRKINITL